MTIPNKSIPTPDSSLRYMVYITPKDSTLNNRNLRDILGFDLVPVINSSNATRSIGAKISTLVENPTNNHYNIRDGDEIYKINNELMRISLFHKIQQRLFDLCQVAQGTPICITLERGSSIASAPIPKPESILKLHNKIHASTSDPKRVFFDSQPEVCLYQEHHLDNATSVAHGDEQNSINSSYASSDFGDHRLVHSIFSPSLKKDCWKTNNLLNETHSDSLTMGSQEYSHSIDMDNPMIPTTTCFEQQIPSTRFAKKSSFIPPPQDQYSDKDHEEPLNQTDYWSYSTASSPVGLSIMEDSESKMSEGKTFISSPGSSVFPKTESLSHRHPLRFDNMIPCTNDTQNLLQVDIPSVIYKNDPYNKPSLDDGSVSTVYMSPLSMRPELSGLVQVRDTLQEDLEGKVSTMRKAVQTLERQIFNQSREARQKISSLESSQVLAEKEIARLESTYVSSSNEAREIRKQLRAKQTELDQLRDTLERERLTFKAQAEKAEELNSDLRAQVDNLSKQLEIQKNKTANARQLAEMELRQQFDAERKENKALIAELCAELKKATYELEELMTENEKLTRKIHELESKLKNERNPPPVIFTDIVKELTSAQAAASAIAKALVQSEHELAICIEAKGEHEKVIEAMKKDATVLKARNMEFEDRILIMSHQLKHSNALVDKLSADMKDRPISSTAIDQIKTEWSSTKVSYENQIFALKKKIEAYSSCVTQEEYARVKNESDRYASILAAKLKEINTLTIKVKDLEDRLKRSDESTQSLIVNGKAVMEVNVLPVAPSNAVGVKAQPVAPSNDMEVNTQPVTPSIESFKQQLSPTFLKTKTRREIILAAGSLKKFRSPLASIQDNGRALAIRLASSNGKENVTCQ